MDWIIIKKEDIAFEKFEAQLELQYPRSYETFLNSQPRDGDYLKRSLNYFKAQGIEIICYQANSSKHPDTYTTTIKQKNKASDKQRIVKAEFVSYPYHSSYELAMRKGLFKAHQIINSSMIKKSKR